MVAYSTFLVVYMGKGSALTINLGAARDRGRIAQGLIKVLA